MGYMKIPNLYKDQTILLFKECYAMEKIDGTSGHICWKPGEDIVFFGGCYSINCFKQLFDHDVLKEQFANIGKPCTIYGEVYGGKIQGQSKIYGKETKFVVFDVMINDIFLSVPDAEDVAKKFGLDFVYYNKVKTDVDVLNYERDRDSEQGKKNGITGQPSEGVILRPLQEFSSFKGRVIAKHKKDMFRETTKKRKVDDPAKLQVLNDAKEIANEWVTKERLKHVLNKLNIECDLCNIPLIIRGMIEDIKIEGEGEIVWNNQCNKTIGQYTANLVKNTLKDKIK